jgi:hypothetical protein
MKDEPRMRPTWPRPRASTQLRVVLFKSQMAAIH